MSFRKPVCGFPGAQGEVRRVLECLPLGDAAILGLPKDCTDEKAITAAARKLWLKVHPDKTNNSPGSKEAFQAVHAAEEALIEKVANLKGGSCKGTASSGPPRTPEPRAQPAASKARTRTRSSEYREEGDSPEEGEEEDWEDYCGYGQWDHSEQWGAAWSFYESRRAFEKELAKLAAAARAAAAKKEEAYQEELRRGANPRAARVLLATPASVPNDGTRINKTFAMREYGLSSKELEGLKPELLQNRHCETYSPEKMYKRQELEALSQAKYQSPNWRAVLQARRDRRAANKAKRQAATADAGADENALAAFTPVKRQRKSGPKKVRRILFQ